MTLFGIVIMVIGFLLGWDIIATIVISCLVTGLISGTSLINTISMIGQSFSETRHMSVFLVTLPVVGILERHGLKQATVRLISKLRYATFTNVLVFYLFFRTLMAMFGVRLGGHIQFIRPIIYPMVESTSESTYKITEKEHDILKSLSCAIENYGNFFGQNTFIGNTGVLLIIGTFQELKISINARYIVLFSLMITLSMILLSLIQIYYTRFTLHKENSHDQ